jgi:hypothetical protein
MWHAVNDRGGEVMDAGVIALSVLLLAAAPQGAETAAIRSQGATVDRATAGKAGDAWIQLAAGGKLGEKYMSGRAGGRYGIGSAEQRKKKRGK